MENQVNDPSMKNEEAEGAVETQSDATIEPVVASTQDPQTISSEQLEKATLSELVALFEEQLLSEKWYLSRNLFQEITDRFEKNFNEILQLKKKEFIDEGGNSIDFYFKPVEKESFEKLQQEYRQKKRKHYLEVEEAQKANQERKEQIIEEIKELIGKDENINQLYNSFKNLQDSWYKTGAAPRAVNNSLWQTFKHHVERFYDFVHINRELRAKDYEHNYKEKLKIIEKAEELAIISDVVKAGRDLDVLHRLWKEDLGPVAREHREELWKRFQEATQQIHKNKQEYHKNFESIQKENLLAKEALLSEMKAVSEKDFATHSQWQKTMNTFQELREKFKNIGPVPRSDSKRTWGEFREVSKVFNKNKNDFYRHLKNTQKEHISNAQQLLEEAKTIVDSDNWQEQSGRMKNIQREWKTLGPIPRKIILKLRKEFFDTCNLYFERLKSGFQKLTDEESPLFEERKSFLNTFAEAESPSTEKKLLEFLDANWEQWLQMDALKESILIPLNQELQKLIDKKIKGIKGSAEEKEMLQFTFKIRCLKGNENGLNETLMSLKSRYEAVLTEVNQLENNLEFFSDTSDSNPLVKEVKTQLDTLNTKAQSYLAQLTQVRQEIRSIKNQQQKEVEAQEATEEAED